MPNLSTGTASDIHDRIVHRLREIGKLPPPPDGFIEYPKMIDIDVGPALPRDRGHGQFGAHVHTISRHGREIMQVRVADAGEEDELRTLIEAADRYDIDIPVNAQPSFAVIKSSILARIPPEAETVPAVQKGRRRDVAEQADAA